MTTETPESDPRFVDSGPGAVRREVARLSRLALPLVLAQLTLMMMGTVDLLMVGRVGVEAVGAVALGNVWKMSWTLIGMGFVFGMDPIVSQAHGARDVRGAGLALQRGVVLAALASIPICLLFLVVEPGLELLGQDPELVPVAADYVLVQLPSIPAFLVWTAMRQYLQGRAIVYPVLWVSLIANALNVVLNWALIFGHLGAPAMGPVGSGIATSAVQLALPILGFAWMRAGRLFDGGWVPWSRAALEPAPLRRIVTTGTPVALQFAVEATAFQVLVVWSGWLGTNELAAHTIVLNMISFSFMVPLGIAMASVTRVGNLLGEGRRAGAQLSAWVAFGVGAAATSAFALVFVVFRRGLPHLYGADEAVGALAAAILPIAAAFQLFDGAQVIGGGVLRGMGRTRPAAIFHGVGFYALGLPLAWWLAFERGAGLVGLWWGLAAGLAAVAVALFAWIRARGPAHAS